MMKRLLFILWMFGSVAVWLPPLAAAAIPHQALDINPLALRSDTLRLTVTVAGAQRISGQMLAAAGWELALIVPAKLHLWRQGQEVPFSGEGLDDARFDVNDAVLFLAEADESRWTMQPVYWLSQETTDGLQQPFSLSPGPAVQWEEDQLYDGLLATPRGDHWFARELMTVSGRDTLLTSLTLEQTAPKGTPLQILLTARDTRPHSLTLTLNGRSLPPIAWAGAGPFAVQTALPGAILPGSLDLQMRLTTVSGQVDRVLIDRIRLPEVRPAWPNHMETPRVARSSGRDVRLAPAGGGASFLMLTPEALRSALEPLVAAHTQLGEQVSVIDVQAAYDLWSWGEREPEALRALIRASQQWPTPPSSVLLVGTGTVRLRVPTADADTTWIPPYLVMADPGRGEIACDTCYGRVTATNPLDQPLPDVMVGRFPAETITDTITLVRKTRTALLAPPTGSWQNRVISLADNDRDADGTVDPAGSFVATSATVLAALPTSMQQARYWYAPDRAADSSFYPSAQSLRCAFFWAFDGGADGPCMPGSGSSGAALLMYVGHGSYWQWAYTSPTDAVPYLWYLYDADARHNGGKAPILLSLTCLAGDFANPYGLMSNDQRLVLWPDGGVVASLSSVGLGVNTGHAVFGRAVAARLTGSGDRTLGQAHRQGIQELIATGQHLEMAYSFTLLGDPSVQLPFVAASTAYLPFVHR